jgi:YfiH family protein
MTSELGRSAASEVAVLRSPAIPAAFAHAFSTRAGGVSEGVYGSLNLGAKWGDDPARVRENRRRYLRAAQVERVYSVVQVHGADVVHVPAGADAETVARSHADALCANEAGCALGIYTADCVPILLCDPRTGAVAAAHAGWRGTVAGVAAATVRALGDHFGAAPADLRVAMGPSIGPCCFEVGDEVAAQFDGAFVRAGASKRGRPTVDLRAANRAALIASGVHADHIDAAPACTACDRERFFSFRRDGRETGQHLAVIARVA